MTDPVPPGLVPVAAAGTGPLRVLLVGDDLRMGGLERVIVSIAVCLDPRLFEVGVAAAAEGSLWSELPERVRREHAPHRVGLLAKVRYLCWLRAVVQHGRYDIVHAHQREVAVLANLAVLGLGVRVVEHVHNTFIPVDRPRTSFRSRYLVACGTSVAVMLREDYRRRSADIRIVLNGVHDPFSRRAAPQAPPRHGAPARVLGVGRLAPQKDPARFVRVAALLRQRGHDIRADWLGDGPLADEVRAQVEASGLGGVVSLHGEVTDAGPWLQRCDVLLVTSRHEGLPLVVLEAMAHARAVVAPAIGSISDAVSDGVTGVLYAPDSSDEQVADTVETLLASSALARAGAAGRAAFVERFTHERFMSDMVELYRAVARAPARAPARRTAVPSR